MEFNLFYPWYIDCSSSNRRQQELNWCLDHNIHNHIFENIYIFPENKRDKLIENDRIHIINYDKRPTYRTVINEINNLFETKDSYNVIANTDIYFDDSLKLIEKINMDKVCLALTRHESNPLHKENGPSIGADCRQSQDVWIIKGHIDNLPDNYFDFYFGLRGCDGRTNFTFRELGYKLYNPCLDIKVYHYHMSSVRHHSEATRLIGDTLDVPLIRLEEIINHVE